MLLYLCSTSYIYASACKLSHVWAYRIPKIYIFNAAMQSTSIIYGVHNMSIGTNMRVPTTCPYTVPPSSYRIHTNLTHPAPASLPHKRHQQTLTSVVRMIPPPCPPPTTTARQLVSLPILFNVFSPSLSSHVSPLSHPLVTLTAYPVFVPDSPPSTPPAATSLFRADSISRSKGGTSKLLVNGVNTVRFDGSPLCERERVEDGGLNISKSRSDAWS